MAAQASPITNPLTQLGIAGGTLFGLLELVDAIAVWTGAEEIFPLGSQQMIAAGLGMGVTWLVQRRLGAGRVEQAEQAEAAAAPQTPERKADDESDPPHLPLS